MSADHRRVIVIDGTSTYSVCGSVRSLSEHDSSGDYGFDLDEVRLALDTPARGIRRVQVSSAHGRETDRTVTSATTTPTSSDPRHARHGLPWRAWALWTF